MRNTQIFFYLNNILFLRSIYKYIINQHELVSFEEKRKELSRENDPHFQKSAPCDANENSGFRKKSLLFKVRISQYAICQFVNCSSSVFLHIANMKRNSLAIKSCKKFSHAKKLCDSLSHFPFAGSIFLHGLLISDMWEIYGIKMYKLYCMEAFIQSFNLNVRIA